jgi:hypothetical protein
MSFISICNIEKLFRQPDTLVQRHPVKVTEFSIRSCNSVWYPVALHYTYGIYVLSVAPYGTQLPSITPYGAQWP